MGPEISSDGIRSEQWLDAHSFHPKIMPGREETRPRIAAWRHMHNCQLQPGHSHDSFKDFPLASTATPITIEEFETERTICVPSRFAWGDFEAISYCWESEVRDTDVSVNNTIVQVPANLGALLQHLQNLPEARSASTWR
jgi:hypothetical protein